MKKPLPISDLRRSKEMKSVKELVKRLAEETYQIKEGDGDKDLAKEDALSLIADFVKEVKKSFKHADDQVEILRAASKTLEFFINEIAGADMGPTEPSTALGFGSPSMGSGEEEEPEEGEEGEIPVEEPRSIKK
jgi:hypothetical protein